MHSELALRKLTGIKLKDYISGSSSQGIVLQKAEILKPTLDKF